MMSRCHYCGELPVVRRGAVPRYCCERAELEALRRVVDEVQTVLEAELLTNAQASMGAIDATDVVSLASAKLKAARVAVLRASA